MTTYTPEVIAIAEGGEVICWRAASHKALVDYLESNVDLSKVDVVLVGGIHGEGMCGTWVGYKTLEDIPHESVPCPCGNPKHWIIKYG